MQMLRQIYEDVVAHAQAELPNECCGFLAGRILTDEAGTPVLQVTHRYPLINSAASPVRYEADPKDLLAASRAMRQDGVEHLAIYHSHPTSDPIPSRTDHQMNFYGSEIIHVILSLKTGQPVLRAWRLEADTAHEVSWACV